MKKQAIFQGIITKQEGEAQMEEADWSREARRAFWQQKFVSLTLAFEPRRQFLLEVKRFLEKNLGEAVIIDLSVDEQITAGAMIVCNNHYKNYALTQKMRAIALEKYAGPLSVKGNQQVKSSVASLP